MIITISREFGSGGREIGKRLADELKIAYYDKEIISRIANKTGMTEEYIQEVSEKGNYSYPFQFAKSFAMYSNLQLSQTEILVEQQKILKEIAKQGDCIIVGRGANIILKEYTPMNIFVYADTQSKIKRCRQKNENEKELTDKEIQNKINQIDKNRRKFHSIISNIEWGEKSNYNLCINTTDIEIKNIISPLADYIKTWNRRKE